jgi:hypothetical protein
VELPLDDEFGFEMIGWVVSPPGAPLTGAGPANAGELIPIARTTTDRAIGNFIRETDYNVTAWKSTNFAVR